MAEDTEQSNIKQNSPRSTNTVGDYIRMRRDAGEASRGRNLDAERDFESGMRYRSQPTRGAGSRRAKNAARSEGEAKAYSERSKEQLKEGVFRGFNEAVRQRSLKAGAKTIANSVITAAARQGASKAFYWLAGLLIPTFGLSFIGMDLLLVISLFSKFKLKLWQTITIVVANIVLAIGAIVLLMIGLVWFCNYGIPGGATLAKVSASVSGNSVYYFCQYFDIEDIYSGNPFSATPINTNGGGGSVNVTVPSGSAQTLAGQIQNSARITLQGDPQGDARSSANQNIADTVAGKAAYTSLRSDKKGAQVALNARMLAGMLAASQVAPLRITFISGGDHGPNSRHYTGSAFDIGLPTSNNTGVMAACRQAGAVEVLGPGDKDHDDHIHCAW